jgi:hypothetical protein
MELSYRDLHPEMFEPKENGVLALFMRELRRFMDELEG